MNGRGDPLLARARFTEQQHRRSGRRHLADQIKGAPEGGTRPHNLRGIAPLPDLVAQVHVIVLQLVPEPPEVVQRGPELNLGLPPCERPREDLGHEFEPRHEFSLPPPGGSGRGERQAAQNLACTP